MAELDERGRRWRLILGRNDADGAGGLTGSDIAIDNALSAVYDADSHLGGKSAKGGKDASRPNVARWLGDIRTYFPSSVVRVMQKDAYERLDLKQMLLEPETLSAVDADVDLVATLMALKSIIPDRTRSTARAVVQRVVDDLLRKLANPMRQAVAGALNRSIRNRRPRHNEIDWNRTIRANLRHYQAEYKTIIPETRIGYGRKRSSLKDVILCIDQSGSMAQSIVYSAIFGAVLASVPALSTRFVVFDTSVVDLTEQTDDPVDLIFGVQLGGGTDINRAIAYCQGHVTRPQETVFILISDLIEGGDKREMFGRVASLHGSGVQFIALLALSDKGAPVFSHENAAQMAALGVPAFACTPDKFPDMMAAALGKRDIAHWAAEHEIVANRA